MKDSKESLLTDLSLMAFLCLVFISVLFIVEAPADKIIHIIALSGIFLVSILTYFTSLTTGLILATCIDFIGLSIYLYVSVTKGSEIKEFVYFWALMLPLFVVSIGHFTGNVLKLQKINKVLHRQVNELNTLDELTGLKNETGFIYDASAYMNMSKRYEHELVLMVVGLRYPKEVMRIVGKEKIKQLIVDISILLEESMRKEDLVYLIDPEKALWGVLMMTNDGQGAAIVNQRVRDKIGEIYLEGHKKRRQVKIDLVIGQSLYNPDIETPIVFLESAKRQMQYDV